MSKPLRIVVVDASVLIDFAQVAPEVLALLIATGAELVRTVLVHGKGGHERLLPVMVGALTALRDYLTLRRELLAGPDRGFLFLGRHGKRMDACTFQQWLRKHAQRALGRPVSPHLLRHSISVHLLRGGADIRHVQAPLGHADLDTTKTYLRLEPGHLHAESDAAMPELAGEIAV